MAFILIYGKCMQICEVAICFGLLAMLITIVCAGLAFVTFEGPDKDDNDIYDVSGMD